MTNDKLKMSNKCRIPNSKFEEKVYEAVKKIPKGEVRSYQWVAEEIGIPGAVRAVGNALNKNPYAPVVPCHRVIRKDGSLGGFASGLMKKKELLRKEGCRAGRDLPVLGRKSC